ncbi:MAG: ArsC family transcriptional regulator, partial [Anaerovoracaceae bacterium]
QFIDLKEKEMSKGEFQRVKQAVGGVDALMDMQAKDKALLALLVHSTSEDKERRLLEEQQMIKTPVVRNGKLATVGYCPEVWKTWA